MKSCFLVLNYVTLAYGVLFFFLFLQNIASYKNRLNLYSSNGHLAHCYETTGVINNRNIINVNVNTIAKQEETCETKDQMEDI